MKEYFYLNPSKMVELSRQMVGSEIKLLLGMMYCISNSDNKWFVNNAENRSRIAQLGFDKTPERFSAILGSLAKKGIIKREANGVYSLPEDLFIVP